MKATSLTLLFLTAFYFASGQPSPSDNYLLKAEKQRKAARVLAIGGTCAVILGAAIFSSTWESSEYGATDAGGYMIMAGLAADLVSIPLFLSASSNKKKAVELSLCSVPIKLLPGRTIPGQPSIGLALRFHIIK